MKRRTKGIQPIFFREEVESIAPENPKTGTRTKRPTKKTTSNWVNIFLFLNDNSYKNKVADFLKGTVYHRHIW
jgi:hypothetical protein